MPLQDLYHRNVRRIAGYAALAISIASFAAVLVQVATSLTAGV